MRAIGLAPRGGHLMVTQAHQPCIATLALVIGWLGSAIVVLGVRPRVLRRGVMGYTRSTERGACEAGRVRVLQRVGASRFIRPSSQRAA